METTTTPTPMSGWKKLVLALLAIPAWLGRRQIMAMYGRAIQYATDSFITLVGVGLCLIVIFPAVNFGLIMAGWHGVQVSIAIIGSIVALIYGLTPAVSVPFTGVIAAVSAGNPGDQVNTEILTKSAKQYVRGLAVVLFWTQAYALVTGAVGFHLYPSLFLWLHLPIAMALTLLLTGKVTVNEKWYDFGWYATLTTIIVTIAMVAVFREKLGPWWAEFSAQQTAQTVAELDAKSIREIDQYYSTEIKKNVFVSPKDGRQVIIVRNEKGVSQEVDASEYIATMEKKRREAIAKVVSRSASGPSAGKPAQEGGGSAQVGKPTECGYQNVCYWENLAREWSTKLGISYGAALVLVVGTLLFHLWLVYFGGSKLKDKLTAKEEPATASATKKADPKSSQEAHPIWFLISVGALVMAGVFLVDYAKSAGAGNASSTATTAPAKK